MSPRILFVNHAGVLGGAELTLYDVARHFRSRSRVLLLSDGPLRRRLESAGVLVDVLPADAAFLAVRREERGVTPTALWGLAKLARRVVSRARRCDVLYANTQKAFVVAAIASMVARKPIVWYLHDILSRDHFSTGKIAAAVRLSRWSQAQVVTHSQACVDAFVSGGGRADRIRRLPYGVDPGPFEAVEVDSARAIRAELAVGTEPCVGVFGRLAPWKGQHVLVEALAHLPRVHALLVGAPLFGEEPYQQYLLDRGRALGVADRLHILGFRADIPSLMQAVDVAVHTSVAAEPFGRVILEAMLAGRPVVATRAGGAAEVVADGVTGALVTPGRADELADAIAALVADPARRHAMGGAGLRRARHEFSLSAMLAGITGVVEDVARS